MNYEYSTEKVIEKYSGNQWMKSLVTLIPYIGSIADLHLNHMAQEFYQNRIELFIKTLSSEINLLQESSIDHDFLVSEEFFDLILCSLNQASKISDFERTSAIAKVIADSILNNEQPRIPPFDIVNVVGEMSPSEASMFGAIGNIYRNHQERLSGSQNTLFVLDDIESVLPEELRRNATFLCSRLESKGLIGSLLGSNYNLEPAGEELLKYFESQCL